MDFVIEVNKMPLPGQTISAKSFTLVPGGKGANQAYSIGKLGANVNMIGAVGKDEYGKKLLENLNSVNVNTSGVVELDNINTGCAFINVDDTGENSIVTIGGANKKITKDFIDNNISLIENADIVVMQLEIPIDIVTYVAKIAKQKGKLVILDPAPAISLPDELYSNVDIIKPNETEIEILSGIKINTVEDIKNAAKQLIKKGVNKVIVTLGDKGSILITNDKEEHFKAMNVKAVDTTAAGDSFTAALAKGLLEGKKIEDSIKYGHLVSSMVVTKKGAQTSIPSEIELEQFYKEMSE